MLKSETKPWIEKYRSKTIDEVIGHDEAKIILKKMIKNKNFTHLLFYGKPGTGKTTIINAYAHELYGDTMNQNVLELNASNDRGINVVRTTILSFVKNKVVQNPSGVNFNLIILDEADAITIDSQMALRKIIEEYSETTQFCFICNYIQKIIYPIVSRCVQIPFTNLNNIDIKNHLINISQKEGLNIKDNIIDCIIKISNYDLRKAIGLLQNIKYYQKIKLISEKSLYDLTGEIPDDIIDMLYEKNKIKVYDKIYKSGYSIKKICEKLLELKINNLNLEQIKIILKIMYRINNGADEYLQFMYLLSVL